MNSLKLFKNQPVKKIPTKQQALFLKTLFELLSEGFSMYQSLIFMEILLPKYQYAIQLVVKKLSKGQGIEKGLRQIGYPLNVVAQLYYGQRQGRFLAAMQKNIKQIELLDDYKKRVIKTIAYPIMMFLFLIVLLLGMRLFLLPHIASFISQEVYDENILIRILIQFFSYLPQLLIGLCGLILIIYLFFDLYLLRQSYIVRAKFLLKLPLLRKWVRWFNTFKLVQTLGYFLEGGYSLKQTIEFIVQYPIDPFLSELAIELYQIMIQGRELTEAITKLAIFQPELIMVIHQGELTSQMATKCLMYGEKLLVNLMEDIAKKISYLQPILFLLIAVFVMSMYLLMMLPMLTLDGF